MSQLTIGGGLNNLGNTCFFNATLQSILHTSNLASILSQHQHSQNCRSKQQHQWCVFCEVESVFKATREAKRFSPNSMIQHLKTIFKKFKLGRQEDSHEFLRYLIEGMQEAETGKLGKERQANEAKIRGSRTFKVFGGVMKTCVECLNCNHKSITTERYYDFNIECQRSNTLFEGISSFFAVDKLEGNNKYHCEHCKVRANARKRFLLETVPQVATFQLKRFTNSMRKIGKFIQFPSTLDLGKFLESPHKAVMKLYAIVVHSGGSSYSGHYYAFVRVGQNWFKMDDGYVTKCSAESVMSQSAYLLFYEKEFEQVQKIEKPVNESKVALSLNGHQANESHNVQQAKCNKDDLEGTDITNESNGVPLRTLNHQQPKEQQTPKPPVQNQKKPPQELEQQIKIVEEPKSEDDQPNAQQQPIVPFGLIRKRSKQDIQKQMTCQELLLRTFQRVMQLQNKLPRVRPRNQSQRQIYNLRMFETVMQKKRKIG